MTPDLIELRGLRAVATVGVLPEERERPQPIEVDVSLVVDLRAAGRSDALADTVDYGAVTDALVTVSQRERPQLLERLAQLLAAAALGVDARIEAVTVSVRKLRPPVPHDLATSGVTVTRRRSDLA